MRTRPPCWQRLAAQRLVALGAGAAVLGLTGCILPPPERPAPSPTPTVQPVQPPEQGAGPPTDATPAPLPRVEPDGPVPDTDTTVAETGELYAGSAGVTPDGYAPDAPHDLVLPPTRGTPVVAPGIAIVPSDSGEELLAGMPHAADGNLLLTTTGRLVLETEEAEYTCSGTVINSESGLIVLTAAHCVFDDDTRDYYDRIAFEPAYERGERPFGTWEATDLWVPQQYLEANDRWLDGADDVGWMGFDFGFIRVAPQEGRTLEDAVGGQGVSFTAETNGVVVAGYPGNAGFDSEVLRFCSSEEVSYGDAGDPNYGIACAMGDGASGSGWVSNVDAATGAGTITAVYSNGSSGGAFGPPLGITAWNGLQQLDD